MTDREFGEIVENLTNLFKHRGPFFGNPKFIHDKGGCVMEVEAFAHPDDTNVASYKITMEVRPQVPYMYRDQPEVKAMGKWFVDLIDQDSEGDGHISNPPLVDKISNNTTGMDIINTAFRRRWIMELWIWPQFYFNMPDHLRADPEILKEAITCFNIYKQEGQFDSPTEARRIEEALQQAKTAIEQGRIPETREDGWYVDQE